MKLTYRGVSYQPQPRAIATKLLNKPREEPENDLY